MKLPAALILAVATTSCCNEPTQESTPPIVVNEDVDEECPGCGRG